MNETELKNEMILFVTDSLFLTRYVCIPEITLNINEYKNEIIIGLKNNIAYFENLINKTNKKTKKYKVYNEKLNQIKYTLIEFNKKYNI